MRGYQAARRNDPGAAAQLCRRVPVRQSGPVQDSLEGQPGRHGHRIGAVQEEADCIVRGLAVIGAGKFAVEVSRYVDDMTSAGLSGFRIEQYLSVPGEAVHAPVAQCIALEAYELLAGTRVVPALSDPTLRRGVIDGLIEKHGLRFSHQESVPVEGRDRRRWPSLQR